MIWNSSGRYHDARPLGLHLLIEYFQEELGYDRAKDFDEQLYLVYGDQKTVSLVQTVHRERVETKDCYDDFNWILSILVCWRMNYMDMIHEIYSGSEHAALELMLYHNKNYRMHSGHKSPFHHGEEVVYNIMLGD